jgi:hypothetical protein
VSSQSSVLRARSQAKNVPNSVMSVPALSTSHHHGEFESPIRLEVAASDTPARLERERRRRHRNDGITWE